jgi:hypothetical protein
MRRQALMSTIALLAAGGPLSLGCTIGPGSIITGSNATISATPSAPIAGADPLARAAQVASTAARGQRCGFDIDAVKVKAAYLSFELKQGAAGPQLAKIEKTYDATFTMPNTPGIGPAHFCSVEEGAEIKRDLERYRAGIFNPRSKVAPDENFESKAFWKDQDDG